jgi:hypothetical protein
MNHKVHVSNYTVFIQIVENVMSERSGKWEGWYWVGISMRTMFFMHD